MSFDPSIVVHPNALVETEHVGPRTRIWAFAHLLPGARVGADCNICDGVFIEGTVVVGDRVTIKCGVQLWDGVRVEDDVFIGPNATFTNDPFPRSMHHLPSYPETVILRGASIGANATILPGVTIGPGAVIGAGTVVTRSVPPHAVVVGNPGRIVRYVSSATAPDGPPTTAPVDEPPPTVVVEGVTLTRGRLVHDLRGNLVARETGGGLPFTPVRFFTVFDVLSKEVRGEHAHRRCEQLLICLRGSVHVVCDDGRNRQEFVLDSPDLALYLPPLVWGTQYRYSPDAVLLVLASHPYDPDDYIRSYDDFVRGRAAATPARP